MESVNLRRKSIYGAAVLAVAGLAVATVGCGGGYGGGGGGGGATASYLGTISGPAGAGGALRVNVTSGGGGGGYGATSSSMKVLAAATESATGTLTLSGCTVSLAGTFDGSSLALQGSGACGTFNLAGMLSGGDIEGTASGAGKNWEFVVLPDSGSSVARVLCGTWTELQNGAPDGATGAFDLVVEGSTLAGVTLDGQNTPLLLSGTVMSGTSVTVTSQGQTIATGTISGSGAAGTYDFDGSQGTWQGQTCP